ncbi:MAG TPA: TolC family protein [Steroidobacteraceae bacterium]|nr:TolC family protein [Steroidobacteraceae bacterium]
MRRAAAARCGALGALAACASLLSGCATYHSRPLPTRPDLARAPALTVPATDLGIPGLEPQPLDPAKGLTETNIVTLAVLGNPLLKAARLQAGIAQAQLLQAGLLPDPQLSGGLAKSSFLTGYNALLSEDIQALITRGAAKAAARAHLEQVNLDILWQEWQVAERARELFIEARALARLRGILNTRRRLLGRVYRQDEASLELRYVTVGQVTADFIAWNSAAAQWRALQLRENQTRHALDELLGLAPGVRIRLRGGSREPRVTAARYRAALASLPRRRPDLLALRAGYHSEEERLREAILAQFPLLDAGIVKSRDPQDGVQSIGFNVTLTLPIFNRNRGPIAVGRASRAYLLQAYQARLDQTTNQADEVWQSVLIMRRQLRMLDRRLAGLDRAAAAAQESLRRGTSTLGEYARVESNALAARAEEVRLRSSLAQAQAVLAMLLALPF